MPKFSERSTDKLLSCEADLIRLFNEVVKHHDCTVTCGFRSQLEQAEAYRNGTSQLRFPDSKHNTYPSSAVDVVPYPIDWNDLDRFLVFIGFVRGVASQMGIDIVSGVDWDSDYQMRDTNFMDYPHYQLGVGV